MVIACGCFSFATTSGSLTSEVNGFSIVDDKHVYFGSYPQREVVGEARQSGVYGKSWGTTSAETNEQYIIDSCLYGTKSINKGNEYFYRNSVV